jgi:carboxymethylenebutenolidase
MTDPKLKAAITLHDRFTHGRMGRRAFMAELTRIAGSGAAAAMLLSSVAANAQARPIVPPDDPRVDAIDDAIPLGRGGDRYQTYAAYRARPTDESGRRGRTVIVIHENRGLNDHIRDVARRFAVAGYTGLAIDFLSPAGGTPEDEDRARAMIGQLDMTRAVAEGAEIVHYVREYEGSEKVGIVGFCWGGAMVNRIAVAAGADLAAGVSFYGPAPDPAEAARVHAAMLIILAGLDERVNATGEPWIAALRAAGKGDGIVYPGVNHAFHNDSSQARYNREAAEAAWAATLAHFERHLGT